MPDIDPGLLPTVRKLLKTFSVLSYGEFDEFDELKNVTDLSKLVQLNLTELLVKVRFFSGSMLYINSLINMTPIITQMIILRFCKSLGVNRDYLEKKLVLSLKQTLFNFLRSARKISPNNLNIYIYI